MSRAPSVSPAISFEFFPPKTAALESALWHAAEVLGPLKPSFVSVTYGAGGTTRARTHEIVTRLQKQGLNAAAHLTCVGSSKSEINAIADSYWQAGIKHIVALRGDPSGGMDAAYTPHPEGYGYAADLVEGLLKLHPFELSVSAYPEVHPAAPSAQADMEALKRKQDAGATRAISQFFFDNEKFLRFRDRAVSAGIRMPIVPGILPIASFAKAQEFARKCGASMPPEYAQLFAGHDSAPVYVRQQTAIDAASEQCIELMANGVEHVHFYTLNRAELVAGICARLGVGEAKTEERMQPHVRTAL
jgi:methylenetetrahydrofolate reductase (NADPH)